MPLVEFCSEDRASFQFLMAVTCSPSGIVTALALCCLSVERLLKKRSPNFSQGFLESEWFLLSSNTNCGMRAGVFRKMSHTHHL